MSKKVTVELSDRVYAALVEKAGREGVSPEEWAMSALMQILIKYNDEGGDRSA